MRAYGIEKLFSNEVLTELLTVLFSHPDEEYHQRRLAAALGRARSPVQRNLERLEKLNLVIRRADGNRVSYKANRSSPLFEDLRKIILKTAGFGDLLKEGLGGLEDRVRIAFIYGSTAKGDDTIESDIDLLIIGDLNLREAAAALSGARSALQREINLSIYSPADFRGKYDAGNHFIKSVVVGEKIFLIGGEDELRAICSQALFKEGALIGGGDEGHPHRR